MQFVPREITSVILRFVVEGFSNVTYAQKLQACMLRGVCKLWLDEATPILPILTQKSPTYCARKLLPEIRALVNVKGINDSIELWINYYRLGCNINVYGSLLTLMWSLNDKASSIVDVLLKSNTLSDNDLTTLTRYKNHNNDFTLKILKYQNISSRFVRRYFGWFGKASAYEYINKNYELDGDISLEWMLGEGAYEAIKIYYPEKFAKPIEIITDVLTKNKIKLVYHLLSYLHKYEFTIPCNLLCDLTHKTIPGKTNGLVGCLLDCIKCGPKCTKEICNNVVYCDVTLVNNHYRGENDVAFVNKHFKRLSWYSNKHHKTINDVMASAAKQDDMFTLKKLYDQKLITGETIVANLSLFSNARQCLRWLACKKIIP
ncbi:hypothetical protein E24_00162 [Faustovirus]|nr:hypothetical protein PRJ_Fausto_00147 [Faustovirus]AMN83093.1 hypothetical protein E24_00162 [Faustovirus]AMN84074.1 hypothetical protein D5a_00160 [Faustovirus]AMN85062.1 hypothetical protein E23_00161 [Faustovirus]QBR99060.1 hypothetical protein [Faustovirus mariensis]